MTALREKAMLVTLNAGAWSARKHDRKVSDEVATQHKADRDVGRYNKVLIARENLKAIKELITAARNHHYDNTVPWDNAGTRLLPVENYFDYTDEQRKLAERFESAVAEFIKEYPDYVEQSRKRLGSLFHESDYPPVSVLKRKFHMGVEVMPMPNEDDFRVSLHDDVVDKIREDVKRSVQQRIDAASDDLWQRLYDCVSHMHKRLTAFDSEETKRLHKSIVGNLVELTGLLTKLNFTDDPNLEKMRQEIEGKLCKHDIEAIKHSESLRSEQTKAAQNIMDQMAVYMGTAS